MTFNYCRFSDTILSLQSSIFVFFRQFFNLPLCEQMRATWDLSLPWLDISVQTPFWSKMGEKGKKTTANFLFQLFEKKFPFFSERASIYECRSIIIWRRNWSLSTKWLKRNQVLCSLFYYPHPLSFYPHFLQFKSSRPSIVRHLKIIFRQLELIEGIWWLLFSNLNCCTIAQFDTKNRLLARVRQWLHRKMPLFRLTLSIPISLNNWARKSDFFLKKLKRS